MMGLELEENPKTKTHLEVFPCGNVSLKNPPIFLYFIPRRQAGGRRAGRGDIGIEE